MTYRTPDANESLGIVEKNKTEKGSCPFYNSTCENDPENCLGAAEKWKLENLQQKKSATPSASQLRSRYSTLLYFV